MPLVGCPSTEDLAAFSTGSLSSESFETIALHLENCQECRSGLEALVSQPDPWITRLHAPVSADPYMAELECQQAVSRYEAVFGQPWIDPTTKKSLPRPLGKYLL